MDQRQIQDNINQLRQSLSSINNQLNQLQQNISQSFNTQSFTTSTSQYHPGQFSSSYGNPMGTMGTNTGSYTSTSQGYGGAYDRATQKRDSDVGSSYYQMKGGQPYQSTHYSGASNFGTGMGTGYGNTSQYQTSQSTGSVYDRATQRYGEEVGPGYVQMKNSQPAFNQTMNQPMNMNNSMGTRSNYTGPNSTFERGV